MLNCVHHVMWVRQVAGGLHQCVQCMRAVTRKDVTPAFDELPEDFRRRWEAHEAARQPAAPGQPPAAENA